MRKHLKFIVAVIVLAAIAGLTLAISQPAAAAGVYQAENATLGGGVTVETEHSGFSGSGYVNFPSSSGTVEYRNADGGAGGSQILRFRYALGVTSARTGQLTVNGATQNITFQPTGAWATWRTMDVTVSLNAGATNTIRLASNGQDLANQDQLEVVGGTVPTTPPPTTPPATTPPPITQPPTTPPPTSSLSINAGGPATGSFAADQYFSGGSTYTNTATIDMSQITSNPPPAAIFNTERYGAMTYTIPNRSGAQTVTLYFAETYLTAAGQRLFNVSVNGAAALSNFDIFASAGGANRAIARTFSTTPNASGQVVIQFTAVTQNPKINGITVAGGSPPPTTPPPTTPPVTTPPPTTPPPTTPPPTNPGATLYVAPNGSDSAPGTLSQPTTLTSAITRIAAGGTIFMRGGTYNYSSPVIIARGNNGTSSARKQLFAYSSETPVLNFSAMALDSANRGLTINGNYWYVRGLIVERAGDNGIFIGGSNNIIERCVTRFNRDSGLQLSRHSSSAPASEWPANNLIVSCESHDNADPDGEDADGFAPKLTVGEGNIFRYDVSHNNIDDGWDLYTKPDTGPIGRVTIENSISFRNGTLSDGSQAGNGDRNGYKLGGEDIAVNHTVRNNLAYANGKHGFTYNRNLGSIAMTANVSIGNTQRNFNFDGGTSVFRSNVSCSGGDEDRIIGNDDGSNFWWMGSNSSRCSSYSGTFFWQFNADGSLTWGFR